MTVHVEHILQLHLRFCDHGNTRALLLSASYHTDKWIFEEITYLYF